MKRAQCKGISLVELLLSLVVIIALVFAAIKYYEAARNNAKVTQAIAQINRYVDASYQWVTAQKGDFCGTPTTSEGKACPDPISVDKLVEGAYIGKNDTQNPWGTTNTDTTYGITVAPADPSTSVSISYDQISEKSCNALNQKLKNKAQKITCTKASDNGSYVRFEAIF